MQYVILLNLFGDDNKGQNDNEQPCYRQNVSLQTFFLFLS